MLASLGNKTVNVPKNADGPKEDKHRTPPSYKIKALSIPNPLTEISGGSGKGNVRVQGHKTLDIIL